VTGEGWGEGKKRASLRGTPVPKQSQGEIPRFTRNKLRNPMPTEIAALRSQ
jgi:hypothetical protein